MLSIRGSQLTSPSPSPSSLPSSNNLLTMKRSQSLDFDSIQQRNNNTQKNVLLLHEDCYKDNKHDAHSEENHVVIGASRFSREYFFSNM
jgi:hypothetical protein